jgi:hypothetical protein
MATTKTHTASDERQRLAIEDQAPAALRPNLRNSRSHTKHQIRQIAESIRVFGFTNPVLVDRKNQVIAGHGRVEAAKLLGMGTVPTIRLEHLTEDQIRAYIIADNRLAENAGWDNSILATELQHEARCTSVSRFSGAVDHKVVNFRLGDNPFTTGQAANRPVRDCGRGLRRNTPY